MLEFEAQGQKYQTLVDFTSVSRPGIFCIQCVEEEDKEELEHPPLVDGLSTILLGIGPTLSSDLKPKWISDIFQIEEDIDPMIRRILD